MGTRRRALSASCHAVLDRLPFRDWRIWPDFTKIKIDDRPVVTLRPIELRRPFELDGFTITAIPVNHPVPTVGYLVDAGRSAALFALDTGPTSEIWEVACRTPHLTTVFIDVAFPDEMRTLAEASGHLTPSMMGVEVERLPAGVRKIASHLKPAYYDRIVAQLNRLAVPNLSIGRSGSDYEC